MTDRTITDREDLVIVLYFVCTHSYRDAQSLAVS